MHGHRHVTKWLVRAAIVLIFFGLGFMMGELRGMLRVTEHTMYSHGTMMHGDNMGMGGYYGGGMGMMNAAPATSTTSPATK